MERPGWFALHRVAATVVTIDGSSSLGKTWLVEAPRHGAAPRDGTRRGTPLDSPSAPEALGIRNTFEGALLTPTPFNRIGDLRRGGLERVPGGVA
jgi:hypothetical protein